MTLNHALFFTQYVDLYEMGTWKYSHTLRYHQDSGYCGIHHISEDPFTSLVVVDAQPCSGGDEGASMVNFKGKKGKKGKKGTKGKKGKDQSRRM